MTEDTAPVATPAPETTMAEPQAPVTFVEDSAPVPVDPQPTAITMQPESQEDIDAAAAAREKVESMAASPAAERTLQETSTPGNIPILTQTQREIEAGRAKVKEHESRQVLVDAKRAKERDESGDLAAAAETNRDL